MSVQTYSPQTPVTQRVTTPYAVPQSGLVTNLKEKGKEDKLTAQEECTKDTTKKSHPSFYGSIN